MVQVNDEFVLSLEPGWKRNKPFQEDKVKAKIVPNDRDDGYVLLIYNEESGTWGRADGC